MSVKYRLVKKKNLGKDQEAVPEKVYAQMCIRDSDDAEVEALKELPRKGGGNQFVTLDRKRQDMEIPVSYTHLDVYKRQAVGMVRLSYNHSNWKMLSAILNLYI